MCQVLVRCLHVCRLVNVSSNKVGVVVVFHKKKKHVQGIFFRHASVTSGTFKALSDDAANCSNFKYGENKDFVRIRIDMGKLRQE